MGLRSGTRLEVVCPGDVVTFHGLRCRVLSSQQEAGLVTLELEDTPGQP